MLHCHAFQVPPEIATDPFLASVHSDLQFKNRGRKPALPDGVCGDLIVALASPRPITTGEKCPYDHLMVHLVRGRRWEMLVRRLAHGHHLGSGRTEQQRSALGFLAELFFDRLWRIHTDCPDWNSARGGEEFEPEPEPPAEDSMDDEGMLMSQPSPEDPGGVDSRYDQLAEQYDARLDDAGERARDYSSGLVDEFALVALHLALRAARPSDLREWMNEPLVLQCLGREWDPRHYEPRLLRVITLAGDDDEGPPGDLLSVRGVAKKIREDQIPRILPSELGLWNHGALGRWLTMDKIINRSPTIIQHFDTRRPENQHRVFLLVVLDVEAATFKGAGKAAAAAAETRGKALAFEMLLNAALRVPGTIEVEVAWLERREGVAPWLGGCFRLPELQASRSQLEAWRNVQQFDDLLAHFFTRSLAGRHPNHRARSRPLAGDPGDHLFRALHGGRFEACFVLAITAHSAAGRSLPPPALRLPRPEPTMNTVLLAGLEAPADTNPPSGDGGLRAGVFRSLAAAHLGSEQLDSAEPGELNEAFLEMLIGPLQRRANAARETA